MNTPRVPILIPTARHPWGATERTPNFIEISPHVMILSLIEGIQSEKEALGDDLGSKMTEKVDRRGELGGFNQNIKRDILQGF